MAGGTEFNRGKFKELVLYLSQASAGDEGFGMVKLNKLLYRADFEAFRRLGHSITGERYYKQEWGPVAHDLLPVLDELEHAGRLVMFRLPAGPYTRKVPTPRDEPDTRADATLFSDEELQVIEDTLQELAVYGGKDVSEWSHRESAGWRVAEIGDEIPYETGIIGRVAQDAPPGQAIEQLRQRVLTNTWD
jgi:hypothetical protein